MKFENLYKHIQKENGIFFEAGANDGVEQSYTYPLERYYGWSGVLVEPSAAAFTKCTQNRPKSICINTALTDDPNVTELTGDFDGHLMSSVNGTRLGRGPSAKVSATTLTNIFDTHFANKQVDLMSIDVENYELQVLQGLDFKKHQPLYILAEIYTSSFNDVNLFLNQNGYSLLINVTGYNHTDNPGWDGTHNDYLFKLNKI